MAGLGPRRGRGPSKRPRESEPYGEPSAPRDSSTSHSSFTPTTLTTRQPSAAPSLNQSLGCTQLPASDIMPPPGKVAIPRPQVVAQSSAKPSKKGRTSHACDACRRAKAACTGEQPCMRCRNAQVTCVYGDGKRDKDRKRMSKLDKKTSILAQHNSEVAEALKRICLDSSLSLEEIRSALDNVIAMTPAPVSSDDAELSELAELAEPAEQERKEESGEDDAAEVGSTRSIDVVTVDTDRDDVRSTGHMGKSSSVAWAKRTAQEIGRESNEPDTPLLGREEAGFTLASYHTEDADIEIIPIGNVDPYAWPDPEVADGLVKIYFDHCHSALPLIDRANFTMTYNNFARGSSNLSEAETIWLSTLNAVFAISSVHAQVTGSGNPGDYFQHLWYCARAKKLCMDQDILYSDARVSTTCALALLSLYYMTTGRLNRAWTLCGLAVRHALTLGMHVRNEASDLSDLAKEQRVRLWWSLYSLECSLNELTGRPTCISDRDISTPLPENIDVDTLDPGQSLYNYDAAPGGHRGSSTRRSSKGKAPGGRQAATYQMPVGATHPLVLTFPVLENYTTSTFFIYRTELTIISHEIITELYCAAAIKEKWSEVQSTIQRIDKRLLAWRDTLLEEFNIDIDPWSEPDWKNPYTCARLSLAMHFNSSRMILYRPCLCRFEGRLAAQSETSRNFNQEGVEACIHSARQAISHLSLAARAGQHLYSLSPWWMNLHWLCEALSVLMLEMAYRSQHLPREASYILDDAKKGINWLSTMASQSVSARKAWEIFDILLRVVAPMINWSVYDMPTEAPVPPGYNSQLYKPSTTLSTAVPFAEQTWMPEPGPKSYPFDSTPQPMPEFTYNQVASNPLDHTTAIQRFTTLNRVRGHYDDPWLHMFDFSDGGAMGHGGGMGVMGAGSQVVIPSTFGSGAFSPTFGHGQEEPGGEEGSWNSQSRFY